MRCIILLMLILFSSSICSDDNKEQTLNDYWNSIQGKAQSAWDGAGNFWQGIKGSVGMAPEGYVYNFKVWNDATMPIFALAQGERKFLGAAFQSDIKASTLLLPFRNSGTTFSNIQMYVNVGLYVADKNAKDYMNYTGKLVTEPAESYKTPGGSPVTDYIGQLITNFVQGLVTQTSLDSSEIFFKKVPLGEKNDPYWYNYHAYTYKDQIRGEFLGICDATKEFVGTFHNSLQQGSPDVPDIIMTFSKNGLPYKVTLEQDSWSLLSSDSSVPNSIRPPDGQWYFFNFYQGTNPIAQVPVAPVGILQWYYDKVQNKFVPGDPMPYTYEVYKSPEHGLPQIGLQGLLIGNYDQPVNGRIRDINPVECHVWYVSAAQQTALDQKYNSVIPQDYSSIPWDVSDQVWISYKTNDKTIQQKITPGSTVDFAIIRPLLREKQAYLYIVALQTTDDVKAKKFLNRLATGKIGQNSMSTQSVVTAADLTQVLIKPLPNTYGIIDDTQGTDASDIIGRVLVADIFMPRGLGHGPYYYSIKPAVLQMSDLASIILPYLDPAKFTLDSMKPDVAIMKDLAQQFSKWIVQLSKDPKTVQSAVLTYLQQKSFSTGDYAILDEKNNLNEGGKLLYDALISGPVSIAHYPINYLGSWYIIPITDDKGVTTNIQLWGPGMNWNTFLMQEVPPDWPGAGNVSKKSK